ncbi:protein SODIUM POTASSIUM ROOT DEFECTIVE 1-like [Andrographis paniculata]|uniref:protein SODIUM POTASSIUM ROOT DEFECTIVE 1-like n=1 Tax=Andrographis paniculata TaxID=175694 RepID=UPI0021E9404B|nr:protein SODIUM POTASSIUM ROOT DEFECTIVE 1-like [Andrographis paniculata]
MKSIDLFCASPASTAICSGTDHRSVVRHRLGGTPRACRPNAAAAAAPCISQLPFDPSRPFRKPPTAGAALRRKSSADADDIPRSPPGSARYLLSDKPFFDIVQDPDRGLVSGPAYTFRQRYGDKIIGAGAGGFRSLSTNYSSSPRYESPVYKPYEKGGEDGRRSSAVRLKDHLDGQKSASQLQNSSTPSHRHQVVELWVSIHCKGCEGKLRKHISRMEGVRSFSIDLATKKVTVIGQVTPLGVLSSISKVKNAQFWPSPSSSSSSIISKTHSLHNQLNK